MAEKLRSAMKGMGTDENALIEIIARAPASEMAKIRADYAAKFNRDLIKDIKSEVGGEFESVLVHLAEDRALLDAQLVHDAIKGLGTDEDLLAEVLCTRHPQELAAAAAAYKTAFGSDMLSDVKGDTSGDFEDICKLLISDARSGSKDKSKVEEDAQALYKAGEGKIGTNEGVFVKLLAGNPRDYVEQLYWKYAEKHGKALDAVIESEFSGDTQRCLIALCTPLDVYYSRRLYKSMSGAGTNDKALIRLITTQKERALKAAAARFLADYKKTLKAWVSTECSGDYKKALIVVLDVFGVAGN